MLAVQTMAQISFFVALLSAVIGTAMLMSGTPSKRSWRAVALPFVLSSSVYAAFEHGVWGVVSASFVFGLLIPLVFFLLIQHADHRTHLAALEDGATDPGGTNALLSWMSIGCWPMVPDCRLIVHALTRRGLDLRATGPSACCLSGWAMIFGGIMPVQEGVDGL